MGGFVNRSRYKYKDPAQAKLRKKSTVRLVLRENLLISRESLNAMIGDGLARIIAAHIGRGLFQSAYSQKQIKSITSIQTRKPEDE
jgi:hypothetical protein